MNEQQYIIDFNPNLTVLDDINHAKALKHDIEDHNEIVLNMENITEITEGYLRELFADLDFSTLKINAQPEIKNKIKDALIF